MSQSADKQSGSYRGPVPSDNIQERWLSIVGIGEDGADGLTAQARMLISGASLVIGSTRQLALAADFIRHEKLDWPSPLLEAIPALLARRGEATCVLASGDPFYYGIGATLSAHLHPSEFICVPAPSSLSLAAAKLGWPLHELATVSLHGRAIENIIPHLQPGTRILVLSWDGRTPQQLAELLDARGFGQSALHILEALGGPHERLRRSTARGFNLNAIDPLNIVGIEVVAEPVARIIPLAAGLPDCAFESDGQLTKREIRAATLSALSPRAGELLWDVGAGSGSIAIEWMLCHASLRAIAIEERAERSACIQRNAMALGTPLLKIVEAEAPGALHDLPQPDAVFIGGGANDPGVFECCWAALKPGGRLVINAVSLETEARLLQWYAALGGELRRLSVERADALGGMTGWRPAMTVTQWSIVKP
ncbi:MAG: precorrin-6y C5,15-methyltransferase (decarboxylating) subunit CbiE [Pseudomonadota bacterium]